jgi:PhnB protein
MSATATDTYLIFNGTCAEAMRFYERTLGGKLDIMTGGQSPVADQLPPGNAGKILHSRLVFDGGVLMASDDMGPEPYKEMGGFAVALGYQTAAEGKRIFETLSKGGKVTMPLGKTFWAEAFGMFVDRFGTPWMINAGPTMP